MGDVLVCNTTHIVNEYLMVIGSSVLCMLNVILVVYREAWLSLKAPPSLIVLKESYTLPRPIFTMITTQTLQGNGRK